MELNEEELQSLIDEFDLTESKLTGITNDIKEFILKNKLPYKYNNVQIAMGLGILAKVLVQDDGLELLRQMVDNVDVD